MSTPRDLLKSTWGRCIELASMNGELEDYMLFAATKVVCFAAGIAGGYWLWAS